MSRPFLTVLALAGLLLALPASARQRTVVSFAKGASSTMLTGAIKVDQDRATSSTAAPGRP